jgi:hypothetical protein
MFGRTLSCLIFLPLLLLSNGSANPKAQAPGNESEKTPMQNAGLAQTGPEGFVAGPDVITGDMADLYVSGIESAELGLSIGITSCNRGNATPHFSPIPSTNHPVVAQNLYRMSGGAINDDRFEQIGQSWVKHTYGASAADECGLGCTDPHNVYLLGVGCSDTYGTGQSAVQSDLGSRAWVNPFTGAFPATARDHTGHIHSNTSHMILTRTSDVDPAANPGATYYAEVQYIVPDEYAWCQAHPTECNMFNNPSYRRYDVTDNSFLIFSEVGATVQMSPALNAWTGATVHPFEGVLLGTDGRGYIAYKVTNPSAGVWHYEYAIYNMNLDRAIQFFRVPLGCGITVSNVGFHAPLNHPGFPHDGTFGDAGFSNAPWSPIQTASALTWSSQTFAQNQNANAIRWGILYNFYFDADQPPQATGAMIGFFKTGGPVLVGVQGPTCNAPPPPTPTPFPPGTAQAVNLSTRMRVQTGDNVGIGGFIITGTAPKHVLLRAVGPTIVLAGVTDALPDPVLELHGPGGFATITNDNWRDDPAQEAAIIATGLAPAIELEAAIDATLDPGTYTAIVRGTNNNSGTGLVEVYDLDQGVAAKLGNISTRAFVGTGADIMIAGFILGSHSDADRIVLRGIGPSLTATGVPNALADPTLELRDSHGALLASNDNWQDNATSAAELIAAGLAPTNNLEAGIATTLPAGSYTALLSGVNNGSGVGLVEVYDRGAP